MADLVSIDSILSPDQLREKYSPEGDGEHPIYTRESWREAVRQEDTISGYWTWVLHQIGNEELLRDDSDAALGDVELERLVVPPAVAHSYHALATANFCNGGSGPNGEGDAAVKAEPLGGVTVSVGGHGGSSQVGRSEPQGGGAVRAMIGHVHASGYPSFLRSPAATLGEEA